MRALEAALPQESFVYLGDHGNAPYGDRTPDEIYALTLRSINDLFELGCRLVVVACNTAAATGLRRLQQTWLPGSFPDCRVIGVIVPVVEEIAGVPWSVKFYATRGDNKPVKQVAVFATQHTVRSNAYVFEIQNRNPAMQVHQRACPGLVTLIEQNAPEDVLRGEVQSHVRALLESVPAVPDVCILGCTHYPIIEHLFRQALPEQTTILSQAEISAKSFVGYLERHPEFRSGQRRQTRFVTTGSASHVSAVASKFYGSEIRFVNFDRFEILEAVDA